MVAKEFAVGSAQGFAGGKVFRAIADVLGQAYKVLRPGPGCMQQVSNIGKDLPCLTGKIVCLKFFLRIPSDNTGQKHHFATGGDAIAIAFCARPVGGL